MRRTIIILCLLFLSAMVYGRGVIHMLVLDWAGPDAIFPDPNTGTLITPADAIMNSLDVMSTDDVGFSMRDDIFFERRIDLPSFLDFYDIVYITLGWRGSGGHIITPSEQMQLMEYLDGNLMEPYAQRALIIEGCDFAYDYGDTSYLHYTYTPLMDYFGAVLKNDSLPPIDMLFGEDSSFAEGMSFFYPTYRDRMGPWTSVDDMDILSTSPYASHARYLFNMGSKGPARGMQRRSYSPGTAIASPVILGNLQDGSSTKNQLLSRMINFSIPPIVRFVSTLDGGNFIIDSTYQIIYFQYDNVAVTQIDIQYSTDNGASWNLITSFPPLATDSLYNWTVPNTPSDSCFMIITGYDDTKNFFSDTTGMFAIVFPAGVNESDKSPFSQLSVHPNPANAEFTVSAAVSSIENYTLDIVDIKGHRIKRLFSGNIPSGKMSLAVDGSSLPSGIYLLELHSEKGIRTTQQLLLIK